MSNRTSRLKILFVCTGNTCRSPMAEGVLRAEIGLWGLADRVQIASAGIRPRAIGQPPTAEACIAAEGRGFSIGEQRSRSVTADDFWLFDWIICMTPAHEKALVGLLGDGKVEPCSDPDDERQTTVETDMNAAVRGVSGRVINVSLDQADTYEGDRDEAGGNASRQARVFLITAFSPDVGFREIRDPFACGQAAYDLALDQIEACCADILVQVRTSVAG